jgi:hypothetical protein
MIRVDFGPISETVYIDIILKIFGNFEILKFLENFEL